MSARKMMVRDTASLEQLKQLVKQGETAEAIRREMAANIVASNKAIEASNKLLTQLSGASSTSALPGSSPLWQGAGPGAPTVYNQNGQPVMPFMNSARPMAGQGGYPGGYGYGMQGTGRPGDPFGGYGHGGYAMGGMGGALGLAQLGVARTIHRYGGAGQGGAAHYVSQVDENGKPTGTYNTLDRHGNTVEQGISHATMLQRGAVSAAAGRVGSAGGVLGMLRSVPAAGMAIGGTLAVAESIHKLGQFVGDQRAANAQYQAIFGPNSSGWEQRQQNFGYRFNNEMSNLRSIFGGTGGLSGSDADRAFKGVSAMGFQGADRNTALSFITSNFNSTGMSVDDSMKIVATNAQQAATSLTQVSEQLKAVSASAVQAGQSAVVWRDAYANTYTAAVNSGFGGASGAIAVAQTQAGVGSGREFAGLDTSGMYANQGRINVLAAQLGMSSLDFSLAVRKNPALMGRAQDMRINQQMDSIVDPSVKKRIQAKIRKSPGGANAVAAGEGNVGLATAIAAEIESETKGAIQTIPVANALRASGVKGVDTMNDITIAAYYVIWVAKNGMMFEMPMVQEEKRSDQRAATPAQVAKAKADGDLSVHKNSAGKWVIDPVMSYLQRDKVTTVEVQTGHGLDRVSLATAEKYYSGQLVNGSAVIASGPNTGKRVGDVYTPELHPKGDPTNTHDRHERGVFGSAAWKIINRQGLSEKELADLTQQQQKQHELHVIEARITPKYDAHGKRVDQNVVVARLDKQTQAVLAQQARDIHQSDLKHQRQDGSASGGGKISVEMKPWLKKYFDYAISGQGLVDSSNQPPTH